MFCLPLLLVFMPRAPKLLVGEGVGGSAFCPKVQREMLHTRLYIWFLFSEKLKIYISRQAKQKIDKRKWEVDFCKWKRTKRWREGKEDIKRTKMCHVCVPALCDIIIITYCKHPLIKIKAPEILDCVFFAGMTVTKCPEYEESVFTPVVCVYLSVCLSVHAESWKASR